jgi:hypothetical protein
MTNIIVDAAKALELLAAAVELKGADYIDAAATGNGDGECRYYAVSLYDDYDNETDDFCNIVGPIIKPVIGEDGRAEPGCFVGHVYYALGLDPAKVQEGLVFDTLRINEDRSGTVYTNNYTGEDLLTKDGDTVTLTPEAQGVLSAAQSSQDAGRDWGMALDVAKAEVKYH